MAYHFEGIVKPEDCLSFAKIEGIPVAVIVTGATDGTERVRIQVRHVERVR